MADYERRRGSKENIGIMLSSTDSNVKFVVQSATVTITGQYYQSGTTYTTKPVDKAPCKVDNQNPQSAHRIDYLFSCDDKVSKGTNTAEFAMTLSDGEVVVRSVTIDVKSG